MSGDAVPRDALLADHSPDRSSVGAPSAEELRALCIETLLSSPEERVYFKDRDGRRILVSAGSLAGLTLRGGVDDVLGKTNDELFEKEFADAANEDDRRILETGEIIVAKVRQVSIPGRPDMWVQTTKMPLKSASGEIIGTYGITRDLTAQVQAERALEHLALHDSLTGLPNRTLILDRLDQLIARSRREELSSAVIFLDLDDFKDINDTLGHQAGDQVLIEIGRRLADAVRPCDTVGRLSGDEFVVLVVGEQPWLGAEHVAARLVEVLRPPLEIAACDVPVSVSASVGIVETGQHDAEELDAHELLKDADIALFQAKATGKRRSVVFAPTMQSAAQRHRELVLDLEAAIDLQQFFLLYQPVVHLDSGQLVGVEALLRWQHPRRGVVGPLDFVGELERTGMIHEVGAWVLRTACFQGAEWLKKGRRCTMAVNVSAEQVVDAGLEQRVDDALRDSGFDPELLILELTESVLVGGGGEAMAGLARLRELGVRIAIDDFGTGYSALAYLRHVPIDILKIDRSFVTDVAESSRSAAVVHALVELGQALGLQTIAEGIERASQLAWFRREHVEVGQGFLFAQPVEAAAIEAMLAERSV